jgi:streptogramin lyase
MRRVALATALLFAILAPAARAEPVGRVEHFPTRCGVGELAAGPDGNVWFSCYRETAPGKGRAMIGRIAPTGAVTEFALPPKVGADDLVAGPDGNVWFTDSAGFAFGPPTPGYRSAIGRITPAGEVTMFRDGLRDGSVPGEIISGPEGALWFTDAGAAPEIGRVTTQGTITEFPTGVKEPLGLGGIAAGPEGNVWFSQVFVLPHGDGEPGALAGRLAPTGEVTDFGSPPAFGAPVSGPGGATWFIDATGKATIDRVTPTGEFAQFKASPVAAPSHLAAGPDGNLWFSGPGAIGRVTPTGEITQFNHCLDYHRPFSEPSTIVSGPGGDLWFTSVTSRETPSMEEAPTIGRVTPTGEITQFKAGIGLEPRSIAAGPDGRVYFSGGNDEVERITPPQAPVNTFVFLSGRVSAGGVAEIVPELPTAGTIAVRSAALLLPHKRTMKLPGAASPAAPVGDCGPKPLRLRLRGAALKRQQSEGTIRVKVTATFTPTGGSPNTETAVAYLRGKPRAR